MCCRQDGDWDCCTSHRNQDVETRHRNTCAGQQCRDSTRLSQALPGHNLQMPAAALSGENAAVPVLNGRCWCVWAEICWYCPSTVHWQAALLRIPPEHAPGWHSDKTPRQHTRALLLLPGWFEVLSRHAHTEKHQQHGAMAGLCCKQACTPAHNAPAEAAGGELWALPKCTVYIVGL